MENVMYAEKPCLCVESVRATADYRLELVFSDGAQKVFDFRPMLGKKIYSALNNLNLFLRAETDGCGVIWNDEIDIDPTYLYEHSIS